MRGLIIGIVVVFCLGATAHAQSSGLEGSASFEQAIGPARDLCLKSSEQINKDTVLKVMADCSAALETLNSKMISLNINAQSADWPWALFWGANYMMILGAADFIGNDNRLTAEGCNLVLNAEGFYNMIEAQPGTELHKFLTTNVLITQLIPSCKKAYPAP
ncbi:MAG: hypothetical protein ACWA5L_08800 [bacterium]